VLGRIEDADVVDIPSVVVGPGSDFAEEPAVWDAGPVTLGCGSP
jgi:hypothetical protein